MKTIYCLVLGFSLLCPAAVSAEERIHIWIKAFIPKVHPSNPGYVQPIPARSGQTMIPGPFQGAAQAVKDELAKLNLDGCFVTDNRNFSDNPTASARLTTEFVLVVGDRAARIEKADGRAIHRCDPSEMVDCVSGSTKKIGTSVPKAAVTGETFGIGGPHIAGSLVQVIFQSAAANILAPPATPDIDYDMDLTYDTSTGVLKFRATLGKFPAFEAYASRNNGTAKKLFSENPVGETVWSLVDFGSGGRPVEGQVDLGGPLWFVGNWESNDPRKRFKLEIKGIDECQLTERGETGASLTKKTRLIPSANASGLYRIERPNDAETITFLFAPEVRAEVLARGPKPSFIDISKNDSGLTGKWSGLLVTKDTKGRLKEMKQPGDGPIRQFEFVK